MQVYVKSWRSVRNGVLTGMCQCECVEVDVDMGVCGCALVGVYKQVIMHML